jgi:hypothetical protein
MRWPDLGYADAYLGSYATFAALRGQGVIPDGVRFQVQYPTPLASIGAYIVPEQQQVLPTAGDVRRPDRLPGRSRTTKWPAADVAVSSPS